MAERDVVKTTKSLCPECLTLIKAEIYQKNGEIRIRKECPKHGYFDEIYWPDAKLYFKFQKWQPQTSQYFAIFIRPTEKGCPFDCGLCRGHKSTTMLAIIDLTNRCNKLCPICFANAAVTGYIYEPTFEQVKEMMELLRKEIPPCPAIQFSGGEPTIRKDFVDIVKLAREMGFAHIQVATNGKRMSRDLEFCEQLKEAGLHTVYLQFDGFEPKLLEKIRGYNDLSEKLEAIKNCRKAGIKSIILVPTVVKNQNSRQLDQIISFAAKNTDVIKGVNFQPISFAGRVLDTERESMRITIPELLDEIEKQTNGQIKKKDFYPVPFVLPISYFVEAWKQIPQVEFTVHPHCGAATYVFARNSHLMPITEFFNVEKFMDLVQETADKIKPSKFSRTVFFLKAILLIRNFYMIKLLGNVLFKGSREAIAEFNRQTLFIGVMHFMDAYNFDLERVQRCGIHYALPDGRIIPFCSYNAIHRPIFEREFAKPKEKPK